MSEYQYYEFQAVDRPLTQEEMRQLRAVSTRAVITPTRFTNHYEWGDFKGDPAKWMERYFDAFFYYANWGTHHLMLRLPARLLPLETARRYCGGWPAQAESRGEWTVLDFLSEEEGEDFWEDEGLSLASVLPVRAEMAAGDLRALYLGWLLRVQDGELDDDEPEPPVPAGLGTLSAAQEAFRGFLRIDPDLVEAAAEGSAPAADEPEPRALRAWLAALPGGDKTELLARVVEGGGGAVRAELLRRLREHRGDADSAGRSRTVGELLAAMDRIAAARRRREAEEAAREKARREREEAAARDRRMEALAGREAEAWRQVEELVAAKKAAAYDEAVRLLVDLRELGRRQGNEPEVGRRIAALRERHATKRSFLERLRRVSLA